MTQTKQLTKTLLISSLALMSAYGTAQASIANTHSTHQSNVATYLAVGQDDLFINSQTGSSDGKSKKISETFATIYGQASDPKLVPNLYLTWGFRTIEGGIHDYNMGLKYVINSLLPNQTFMLHLGLYDSHNAKNSALGTKGTGVTFGWSPVKNFHLNLSHQNFDDNADGNIEDTNEITGKFKLNAKTKFAITHQEASYHDRNNSKQTSRSDGIKLSYDVVDNFSLILGGAQSDEINNTNGQKKNIENAHIALRYAF
ncbi:MAG: hypothetical protein P8L77_05170 [Gammaproteobacteria bacterium]|nr:hypothetical protein [Gammaproteobacteria bacterium]